MYVYIYVYMYGIYYLLYILQSVYIEVSTTGSLNILLNNKILCLVHLPLKIIILIEASVDG